MLYSRKPTSPPRRFHPLMTCHSPSECTLSSRGFSLLLHSSLTTNPSDILSRPLNSISDPRGSKGVILNAARTLHHRYSIVISRGQSALAEGNKHLQLFPPRSGETTIPSHSPTFQVCTDSPSEGASTVSDDRAVALECKSADLHIDLCQGERLG